MIIMEKGFQEQSFQVMRVCVLFMLLCSLSFNTRLMVSSIINPYYSNIVMYMKFIDYFTNRKNTVL